ncbi:MAG: hypothetical protein H6841_06600 [Planctomycetes bacterium]|nr:hypothetical protein [Planctomycetota bacterium]MCB9936216.1 hypothetical protein [Planctomycetota bacterium]
MKTGSAIAGCMAMLAAVILLWLMDVNFMGWLGAWLAPGAAWPVGVAITLAFAAGLGLLWGVLAKQPAAKKLPRPAGGLVYGIAVGMLFVFLVPLVLSAIAGDPSMFESTGSGFDVFPEAFGAHAVPALPDLGFEPPLAALSERDWVSRDDFTGRLLSFGLAFALFGVLVDVLSRTGR